MFAIMRKLTIYFLALMAFVACSDSSIDDDGSNINDVPSKTPEINLGVSVLNFTAEGGFTNIIFTSSDEWIAVVANDNTDGSDDWCTVSPKYGSAGRGQVTITVAANDTTEDRTATVLFKSGITEEAITVAQQTLGSNQLYIEVSCYEDTVYRHVAKIFGSNVIKKGGGYLITLTEGYNVIPDYAFSESNWLNKIIIGSGITSIGYAAFSWCESLTSVTIPDSVTSIGDGAFYRCTSLKSVTIPDSVTSIGDDAFQECKSLKSFYGKFASEDNRCLIIDGVLHSFACSGLSTYTIPDSVTSIGDSAFYGCSSLTSVTIPDNVTLIGRGAFDGCSSLSSITIPDSVTSIGDSAFSGCISLIRIIIPDSVTSIGDYAFSGCERLTSVTIPDSVISIGNGAFGSCYALTSVTIPDSVISIGGGAFSTCRSLTSVTIPDSVTSIEGSAFSGCSSLTSVTIPDSVTSIGYSAFEDCYALTSVTIPDGVTSIEDYAFYGCSSLTSVYCKPTTPPILENGYVFGENAKDFKIYVPMDSVNDYKNATYWSSYASSIEGYNF